MQQAIVTLLILAYEEKVHDVFSRALCDDEHYTWQHAVLVWSSVCTKRTKRDFFDSYRGRYCLHSGLLQLSPPFNYEIISL